VGLVGAAGAGAAAAGRGHPLAAYVWDDFEDEGAYPDLRDAPGSSGWVVAGATRRPAPLPDRAADGAADFYRGVAAALKACPAGPEGYAARQAALPVDPEEAVHTLAVIDAARISSVERREVAVAAG
jgi:predicted dehydrogenase